MRMPRIASLMIHRARGGYVDVPLRDGKFKRVDTVAAHAKPSYGLIGANGVVLPIRNKE